MLSILIVDDEAPIREWIAYCIQKAGEEYYVIGTEKTGNDAYEKILREKPNVVITDIRMPGIDGIELMQSVKKVLPYTKFVILTNHAEFSYAKKAVSYGAVEYLLKSELRSVDLINILEKLLKEQSKIVQGKNNEILSNGYIDLYSIYQNINDDSYITSFWKSMGMNTDKPYCLIGIPEESCINQRELISQIAKDLAPYYCNAAFRDNIIYIILQEATSAKLELNANGFARNYYRKVNQHIAVGEIQENLNNFVRAVEQIQSALSYAFFKPQSDIFYYNNLIETKRLDRDIIRQHYKDILSLLALKQYEKTIHSIDEWFENFVHINILDIIWAKEMCIKLVISVEERFYQLNSEYEYNSPETQQLKTAERCKTECLKMLEKMLLGKDGIKSKSINEALNFIHKNYNKDISLINVAAQVYRSPEYFSRLFKEEVGMNFSVYLMIYRLGCAEQLLKTSGLPISKVAYEVGYTNPGYFSRIYKKYMGMTPEEARSQNSSKKSK